MLKLLYFVFMGMHVFYIQENVAQSISDSIRECYENKYLLERDNRLPHTLNALLAILRKIENTDELNMDLRTLSVALLHRFRQDGIHQNPAVQHQDGVTPYAASGYEFHRHNLMLCLIQGNAIRFPNNSITDIEKCTLHFMLSNSIEIFERGDEGTVCRFANSAYRRLRSIDRDDQPAEEQLPVGEHLPVDDAEVLSPELKEAMENNKDKNGEFVPNSLYPEFPPNHPDIARMKTIPHSKCPVENGIIKTSWGVVSGGTLVAGIAAALESQAVSLKDLKDCTQNKSHSLDITVDNKWLATLSGDLAAVALRQGPSRDTEEYKLGVEGNWNSTSMPRWYFLNSNEKLELTAAKIRGDLDGLILANEISRLYRDIPGIRLSQILDMYYSSRGLLNSAIRACNRRLLLPTVAPNATISEQAFSAALLLRENLLKVTADTPRIKGFAVEAVNQLLTYIPGQMNQDLSCLDTDRLNDGHQLSVDLTIILDTNWPFTWTQSVLAALLDNMEINPYNSNFTVINGYDGSIMINMSNSLLDFYSYNASHYANATGAFDLSKSLDMLRATRHKRLNIEREQGLGGSNSDVVLIIPYKVSMSPSDKEYCLEELRRMREEAADTTILILTSDSKDIWSDFVSDPKIDIFSINMGDTEDVLPRISNLISRIKQVPKRLINSQCGANYIASGNSNSFVDFVEPQGINFYRMHPNYFFSSDSSITPTIKVQVLGSTELTVCSSRQLLHVNATGGSCASISNNVHSISVSCIDATFIHECPPLYLSISTNATVTTFECTDPNICRRPDLIKYTISYESLTCISSANRFIFEPVSLIFVVVYTLYVYS